MNRVYEMGRERRAYEGVENSEGGSGVNVAFASVGIELGRMANLACECQDVHNRWLNPLVLVDDSTFVHDYITVPALVGECGE
jgi:hypothetical protein